MTQKLKETKSKSGRKGNNEGSIYQRASDSLWCGSVTTGYKTDGKPIRKTVYGKTKQEIIKKVSAMTAEVFTNGYTTVSAKKELNFKVLFEKWFNLYGATNMSSGTQANRRNLLDNHIYKDFGELDVGKISTDRLQRYFNTKSELLASDTVAKQKQLLSRFYKHATERHYVATNPMTSIILRTKVKPKNSGKALEPKVRQQVFAAIADKPILKPIITTLAFTGLRPQELIALPWVNINLESKVLSVTEACIRTATFNTDGSIATKSFAIGDTKTVKSVRAIIMPEVVIEVLREWQEYCIANSISSRFVFPNTKTGEMRTYSGLRSILQRFVKSHGFKDTGISLYTFRHTFATILLELRESPKIVAELMGHTKVSTTLDIYSHIVDKDVYKNTAQMLDGVYTTKICLNKSAISPADVVTTTL